MKLLLLAVSLNCALNACLTPNPENKNLPPGKRYGDREPEDLFHVQRGVKGDKLGLCDKYYRPAKGVLKPDREDKELNIYWKQIWHMTQFATGALSEARLHDSENNRKLAKAFFGLEWPMRPSREDQRRRMDVLAVLEQVNKIAFNRGHIKPLTTLACDSDFIHQVDGRDPAKGPSGKPVVSTTGRRLTVKEFVGEPATEYKFEGYIWLEGKLNDRLEYYPISKRHYSELSRYADWRGSHKLFNFCRFDRQGSLALKDMSGDLVTILCPDLFEKARYKGEEIPEPVPDETPGHTTLQQQGLSSLTLFAELVQVANRDINMHPQPIRRRKLSADRTRVWYPEKRNLEKDDTGEAMGAEDQLMLALYDMASPDTVSKSGASYRNPMGYAWFALAAALEGQYIHVEHPKGKKDGRLQGPRTYKDWSTGNLRPEKSAYDITSAAHPAPGIIGEDEPAWSGGSR